MRYWISSIFWMMFALSVGATEYVVVTEEGEYEYSTTPPVDLTYPSEGELAPMAEEGEILPGIEISKAEYEARMSQRQLIIFELPLVSER